MYDQNCFVTLTFDDDHVGDNRLRKEHFQTFINDLRGKVFRDWLKHIGWTEERYQEADKALKKEIYEQIEIPYFATGEYGDKSKRQHWHAILFNFSPPDKVKHYVTELGHQVYTSEYLRKLWPHGNIEVGSVTFESAGYVARYSAKKLAHGEDQMHKYQPVHLRSKKHAIGKAWLEKYWNTDCFNQGFILLENGAKCSIPRYYTKWLKKTHPDAWVKFVSTVRATAQNRANNREQKIQKEEREVNENREFIAQKQWVHRGKQISRNKVKKEISEQKFKRLQSKLKGNF